MSKQPPLIAELQPEMRLLLLCAVNKPLESDLKQIQELIQSRPDWNAFYKLTMKHRVYPVVYKNLQRFADAGIDSKLMSELDKKSNQNRIKSLQYAAELIRLTGIFEEHGVRAVSLKGPVLSLLTCGDISMRMSKDLDILVCPAELEKAEQILVNEGYKRDGKVDQLTPRQRSTLLKTEHHFSYVNKIKGINIELHWRFDYESYNYSFAEIWAQKAEADLSGKTITVLNAEENLLFLAFHGSKHAWFRLKWLCDIVELIKADGLDWNRIFKRANELGIEHLLGQTLILANLLFKTETHTELFGKKVSRFACRLARLALPFILSADDLSDGSGHQFYLLKKIYMFVWNTGIHKKLAFIMLHFYPIETDFAQVKLTDKQFAGYYLLRPILAVWRRLASHGKRDVKA